MKIAICDDCELQVEYFKHRIEPFLKQNGDRNYTIDGYFSGEPLIDDRFKVLIFADPMLNVLSSDTESSNFIPFDQKSALVRLITVPSVSVMSAYFK